MCGGVVSFSELLVSSIFKNPDATLLRTAFGGNLQLLDVKEGDGQILGGRMKTDSKDPRGFSSYLAAAKLPEIISPRHFGVDK